MPGALHFVGAPLPSLPSSDLLLPWEVAALAHLGPGRWEARREWVWPQGSSFWLPCSWPGCCPALCGSSCPCTLSC